MALRSPNTIYPLIKPATNVSNFLDLPLFNFRWSNIADLYSATKDAKLTACVRVALSIARTLDAQLYEAVREEGVAGIEENCSPSTAK